MTLGSKWHCAAVSLMFFLHACFSVYPASELRRHNSKQFPRSPLSDLTRPATPPKILLSPAAFHSLSCSLSRSLTLSLSLSSALSLALSLSLSLSLCLFLSLFLSLLSCALSSAFFDSLSLLYRSLCRSFLVSFFLSVSFSFW